MRSTNTLKSSDTRIRSNCSWDSSPLWYVGVYITSSLYHRQCLSAVCIYSMHSWFYRLILNGVVFVLIFGAGVLSDWLSWDFGLLILFIALLRCRNVCLRLLCIHFNLLYSRGRGERKRERERGGGGREIQHLQLYNYVVHV